MDYKALKWSVHDNPQQPRRAVHRRHHAQSPRETVTPSIRSMRLELDALRNEIARNSISQGRDLDRRRTRLLRWRRSQV